MRYGVSKRLGGDSPPGEDRRGVIGPKLVLRCGAMANRLRAVSTTATAAWLVGSRMRSACRRWS